MPEIDLVDKSSSSVCGSELKYALRIRRANLPGGDAPLAYPS